MSSVSSKHSIDLKSKLFRGYSDPARLSILEALRGESLSVSEIVELTGLNQSNVSNHLSCLKECSLVTCEQHGRYVYYRLSDPRINSMLVLAEDLLSDIGNRVYECTRYRS
ncbi:MAG: metalloregulator ArsR/SmtB family transcription factor [Armatimonadetes bacterium]|nr:metalloregulator ArsR/SmtB family transcription factor [Armatimonadota bacterium]